MSTPVRGDCDVNFSSESELSVYSGSEVDSVGELDHTFPSEEESRDQIPMDLDLPVSSIPSSLPSTVSVIQQPLSATASYKIILTRLFDQGT